MKLNNKGFSLVEIIIVAGIFGIISVMIGRFFTDSMKINKKNRTVHELRTIRDSFAASMRVPANWTATQQNNATEFECIVSNNVADKDCCRHAAGNCSYGRQDVTLYIQDGADAGNAAELMYNGYDPVANNTHGFTSTGDRCNQYPSTQCPFQFRFFWEPLCPNQPNPDCYHPSSELTIELHTELSADDGWMVINTTGLGKVIGFEGRSVVVTPESCGRFEVVRQISADGDVECVPWMSIHHDGP